MIQLSTLPLLPTMDSARPAGSPLATTSDFAMAMAELTATVVTPAIMAPGDMMAPKLFPTLQKPAVTGSDLPEPVVLPDAPVAIPAIPPAANEQAGLEEVAPFVIITFADPLPGDLSPFPARSVQTQLPPTPEARVVEDGRANREPVSQNAPLAGEMVRLPVPPLEVTAAPALPVAVSRVSDSAPRRPQPPVIAEAIAATPPAYREAAPHSRREPDAHAIAPDRSRPSVTIPADAGVELPSDDPAIEDAIASVDQTAPVPVASSIATPIAESLPTIAPVPVLPVSVSDVIASNPAAIVEIPRTAPAHSTTPPPFERVAVPASQTAAGEPVKGAIPQPPATGPSVPEPPTPELSVPGPSVPEIPVREPSSPTDPSPAPPAPQAPAAARTVTIPFPMVAPALATAPARQSTAASTARPTHVVDPAMSAPPSPPLARVLRQSPAETIVSRDLEHRKTNTIAQPISPVAGDILPAVTPESRVAIPSQIVAPTSVAVTAQTSPAPTQVIGNTPADTPAPVASTPTEPIPAPFQPAPARVTFVVATHTPAPVAAPAPAQPQPAAQVFAAAMFAFAEERPVDSRTDDPTNLITSLPTPPSTTVTHVPTDVRAPTLNTTRTDWMERMIDRIETIRDTGGASETRIRLSPDALGRVDVAVTRDTNGTLQVRMVADTPQAQQLLTEAAPRLAEMAEARGLKFGGSGVDAGSGGNGQRQPDAPTPARPLRPTSARTDADTPTDTRLA